MVARQHLRYITWIFPFSIEYVIPGERSHQDWIKCVDILNRDFDITMLNLTLDFSFLRTFGLTEDERFTGGRTHAEMEKLEHSAVGLVCLFFIS